MWGLSSIAAAAAALLRRMAGASRPGSCGAARHTGPTPSAYSNLVIQRERLLADYAQAARKHRKRKHLAKRACSATHEMLRAEVGNAR